MSKKSGLADSPFFAPAPAKTESDGKPENPIGILPALPDNPRKKSEPKQTKTENPPQRVINNDDTMTPRYHDTTTPRYHDTKQPQVYGVAIELVRKAVKEYGKEAATHRFTSTEKKEIADLIYTYKNTGVRTSENEVTRIAVNFVIEDYRVNGENSVLHKILTALNE